VLTLRIFRKFSGKLFVLFLVLPKAPEAGTLAQKKATHFLHEVLWAKGYRVNTLGSASCDPQEAEPCNEVDTQLCFSVNA